MIYFLLGATFSGGACPACLAGKFPGHAPGHAGQAPPLNGKLRIYLLGFYHQ